MNEMPKIPKVQMPTVSLSDQMRQSAATGALLHEVTAVVSDYRADPVSKAYQNLFDSEAHRTREKCGSVMPKP